VILVGRMHRAGVSAMDQGFRNSGLNTAASAVLDCLARDIESLWLPAADGPAVDPVFSRSATNLACAPASSPPGLFGAAMPDELYLVARSGTPDAGRRAFAQVHYFVAPMQDAAGADVPNRFRLARSAVEARADLSVYREEPWYDHHADTNAQTVVENVRTFRVEGSLPPGGPSLSIYLEAMTEADAARLAEIWSAAADDAGRRAAARYADRAVRRYACRIAPDGLGVVAGETGAP